jgi:DNA-binding Lrp family transcriptional regulator
MELDKFDLAILAVLQQDARASLQDISARVGLSTTPCWTRILHSTKPCARGMTKRLTLGTPAS